MIKVYNIIDQCLSLSNTLKALIIFKYIQFGKDKRSMEDLRSKSYKTQREFCAEIVDIQNILTYMVCFPSQASAMIIIPYTLFNYNQIVAELNFVRSARLCRSTRLRNVQMLYGWLSYLLQINIEFKKKKCDELVEELHTMHQCLFTNVPIYFRNRFVDHRLFSGRCRNFIII